ncbi:hypothetical protein [Teredinibacter purpureus]|uniref:hypothetical protein n=1 Tax=Teredinibacter purpureus TaxID=2731756 RepID=UPI0006973BCD|nr:hypothetical protein [Teredinibacter purpureus]
MNILAPVFRRLVIISLISIIFTACNLNTFAPSPSVAKAAETTCSESIVICENFEHSDVPPSPWQFNESSNLSISTTQTYSGSQALEVHATGGGYNAHYLRLDLQAYPNIQTELFGRMMVHLSDENALGGDFTFIEARGKAKTSSGAPPNTPVVYRGRLDGRHDHFMANYDTWVDNNNDGATDWLTDCWKHPNANGAIAPPAEYQLPKNQWACVQWHYSAPNNEMAFWLDGKELTDLHVRNTGDGCLGNAQQNQWTGPESFEVIQVGIEQYHNGAKPRTLFIDDIALDDSMIACP